MIKLLKLRKAVFLIVLGFLALITSRIMSVKDIEGSSFLLGVAGVLFIIGSLMFLYPILFAKKIDNDSKKVELKPMGSNDLNKENITE